MIKLTTNSKELNEIVKFIANISCKYSLDKETNIKVSCFKKKGKLMFASKGILIEAKVPSMIAEKEGEFVVDAFLLENLPTRANETTLEVDKDKEGSYHIVYSNGKNKGDLVIANDISAFNRQIMDSSEYPSKFIRLSKEQLAKTVSKVLYNSSDSELDKKIGLPLKIINKGNKATIYSGDRNSALIYKITLKEKTEKCEILTQGTLIKDTFTFAKDYIDFASNETYTRLKCSTFDVIVPTQELVLFNLEDFLSKHTEEISKVTFKMQDMINALEDTQIISNIANISSRFNIVFKDDKISIINKANVGKAKSTFKAKGSKEFDLYSQAEWFTSMQKNFDGKVTMHVLPSVAIINNEDETVTAILPLME